MTLVKEMDEGNGLKQNQYENMDDQAHRESLIGSLNLIKSNLRLLQIMYYEDMFEDINIDDIFKIKSFQWYVTREAFWEHT